MLGLRCCGLTEEGIAQHHNEAASLAVANCATQDSEFACSQFWVSDLPEEEVQVLGTNPEVCLRHWISQNSASLGTDVAAAFGGDHVPFVLKVIHKDLRLSFEFDLKDRHPPQLFVAVTAVDVLCGLVSNQELLKSLQCFPELSSAIGVSGVEALRQEGGDGVEAFKAAVYAVLGGDLTEAHVRLRAVMTRLGAADMQYLSPREQLVLHVHHMFSWTMAALATVFLNRVTLQPGEAIEVDTDEPYVYLSGDLVELSASNENSDRSSFVAELQGEAVLCGAPVFKQGLPVLLSAENCAGYFVYRPLLFDDVELLRVGLPAGESLDLPVSQGPTVLLVQLGMGAAHVTAAPGAVALPELLNEAELKRGGTFFLPAGAKASLTATVLQPAEQSTLEDPATATRLTLWVARVNERFFTHRQPCRVSETASGPSAATAALATSAGPTTTM